MTAYRSEAVEEVYKRLPDELQRVVVDFNGCDSNPLKLRRTLKFISEQTRRDLSNDLEVRFPASGTVPTLSSADSFYLTPCILRFPQKLKRDLNEMRSMLAEIDSKIEGSFKTLDEQERANIEQALDRLLQEKTESNNWKLWNWMPSFSRLPWWRRNPAKPAKLEGNCNGLSPPMPQLSLSPSELMELEKQRKALKDEIHAQQARLIQCTALDNLRKSMSATDRMTVMGLLQSLDDAKIRDVGSVSASRKQDRHYEEVKKHFAILAGISGIVIMMTTAQASDLLPPDVTFDIGMIDEASTVDCSALTVLSRCDKWLVVGDSMQNSPTGKMVKEEKIRRQQDFLPSKLHPVLKGRFSFRQSFFDLCRVGFPNNHRLLDEHFRGRSELIEFSNKNIYFDQVYVLKPPGHEKALCDHHVHGVRDKKKQVNEVECDAIVKFIQEIMHIDKAVGRRPTSICVLSLGGQRQSDLIASRLAKEVDAIDLDKHQVLVDHSQSVQGVEREVVLLSLCYSPSSRIPTQTAPDDWRRANVALTRARERMVLFRSMDMAHIKNRDDVKYHIIKHFVELEKSRGCVDPSELICSPLPVSADIATKAERALMKILSQPQRKLRVVRSMGNLWKGGVVVGYRREETDTSIASCASNSRITEDTTVIAVCVENAGETKREWKEQILGRQRTLQSSGWSCLLVSLDSLLFDTEATVGRITDLLRKTRNNRTAENDAILAAAKAKKDSDDAAAKDSGKATNGDPSVPAAFAARTTNTGDVARTATFTRRELESKTVSETKELIKPIAKRGDLSRLKVKEHYIQYILAHQRTRDGSVSDGPPAAARPTEAASAVSDIASSNQGRKRDAASDVSSNKKRKPSEGRAAAQKKRPPAAATEKKRSAPTASKNDDDDGDAGQSQQKVTRRV